MFALRDQRSAAEHDTNVEAQAFSPLRPFPFRVLIIRPTIYRNEFDAFVQSFNHSLKDRPRTRVPQSSRGQIRSSFLLVSISEPLFLIRCGKHGLHMNLDTPGLTRGSDSSHLRCVLFAARRTLIQLHLYSSAVARPYSYDPYSAYDLRPVASQDGFHQAEG